LTTRRFLLGAVITVVTMAAALALAELLDAPWLRLVAVALLVGIFIAHEAWMWWGEGRKWLAIYGVLLAAIALAFIAQRLAD
jgi:hypothetical protein